MYYFILTFGLMPEKSAALIV